MTTNEITPVTDTPVTDTPVTDTPVTDTPVTDTPVTDTPVTDTPVTPIKDLTAEDLLSRIPAEELAKALSSLIKIEITDSPSIDLQPFRQPDNDSIITEQEPFTVQPEPASALAPVRAPVKRSP
jgi:hypothetical protein